MDYYMDYSKGRGVPRPWTAATNNIMDYFEPRVLVYGSAAVTVTRGLSIGSEILDSATAPLAQRVAVRIWASPAMSFVVEQTLAPDAASDIAGTLISGTGAAASAAATTDFLQSLSGYLGPEGELAGLVASTVTGAIELALNAKWTTSRWQTVGRHLVQHGRAALWVSDPSPYVPNHSYEGLLAEKQHVRELQLAFRVPGLGARKSALLDWHDSGSDRQLASRTTRSANGTVTITRSPSALAFSDSLMRRRISALHKAAARSRTYTPPKTVHHAPHHPIHGGPLRGGGYFPHTIAYSSGSTSTYSGATKVSSTPKPQTAWSVHQQQAWASG